MALLTDKSITEQIISRFQENANKKTEYDEEYFGVKVGKDLPCKNIYDAFISKIKFYTLAIEYSELDGQFMGENVYFYRKELNNFQNNFHNGLGEDFDKTSFLEKAFEICIDKCKKLESSIAIRRYFLNEDKTSDAMEKQLYHLSYVALCINTTDMDRCQV